MKVNNKRLWGKKALVLNETTCALTFTRLFEYSDYIVAVETLQLWLCSRCCNKLDIIGVHTLWFSLSYLECASDIVHGNLAGRSDMAAAGTDVAVGRLHPPRPYPFFSLHGWSLRCWNHLHMSCHSAAEGKAYPHAFKKQNIYFITNALNVVSLMIKISVIWVRS